MKPAPTRRRLSLDRLEDRRNPSNDLFADAEVLSGQYAELFAGNYTLDPDTFEVIPFAGEPGEPDHAGAADPLQSGWYTWTAPLSARAIVSLSEFSGSDLAVGVYTGAAVDSLTEVASGSGPFVDLKFDTVAGTTYHIAVDSAGDRLVDFVLDLSAYPPPANDDFADAFVLNGAVTPAVVAPASSLAGSTTEPGEPNHAAGVDFGFGEVTLGPSVWYSWTAPTTGPVLLDLNSTFDFGQTGIIGIVSALAVYTGGAIDGLTPVANTGGFLGDEFIYGSEQRLSFDATAGTTYHIAAAGSNQFPNDLELTLINGGVPGAVVIDGTLYVVGTPGDDAVKVKPAGAADDGSTGVTVRGTYDGQPRTDTLPNPVAAAEVFLFDGDNAAELAGSLAFPVQAEFGNGDDTFRGGRGDTTVRVGDGNDSVRTGAGADSVFAGEGTNDVRTAGGSDVVRVGKGDNTVSTGDGDDTVVVAIPPVVFWPDFPTPGTGANVIDTGAGDDAVHVLSNGPSAVTTGAGDDRVTLEGAGSDAVSCGDGDDVVDAGRGNNVVSTGAGDDSVFAGFPGNFSGPTPGEVWSNTVDAGDGNDRVRVTGRGPIAVSAGAGDDDVVLTLLAGSAPLTGPAVVSGGAGDDVLMGWAGDDRLDGGAGNDILVGGAGADALDGGAGDDVLFDGLVRIAATGSTAPASLRAAFAGWDADDPATYAAVRSKLAVTPSTSTQDVLTGGAGRDWFWSNDPLDVLDRAPIEVRN